MHWILTIQALEYQLDLNAIWWVPFLVSCAFKVTLCLSLFKWSALTVTSWCENFVMKTNEKSSYRKLLCYVLITLFAEISINSVTCAHAVTNEAPETSFIAWNFCATNKLCTKFIASSLMCRTVTSSSAWTGTKESNYPSD